MRFWADERKHRKHSSESFKEERAMRTTRFWTCASLVAAALLLSSGVVRAEDISGLITTTRTITEHSRLVGDVTCRVTGAPCIRFGSSHIDLRLNGFTMTGQADPITGCNGATTAGETGISTNGQTDVEVRGPGVVQQFRADGILFMGTLLGKVEAVTTTTNCLSGIRVNATSSRITLGANVSVRNGSTVAGSFCGGI
ncbi:MAG: hypothetical protein DMF91_12795 [Acidobacteria bacterium]|nr:MAG: hypothetical protein DMF91_12795 [Acidobacteriota bacterium]